MGMAEKRTKADRLERQTEQLEERADRHPDEIEKKPSTLAPKSDEPTVLIPHREANPATRLRTLRAARKDRRSRFGRLAPSRARDKRQAGERSNGIASGSPQERLMGRRTCHS